MSNLSKEYTHTVKVQPNYIHFSNDKELQNQPINELEFVLRTSGFNLLQFNIFKNKIDIDLNKLQKKGKRYYYLTNENLPSLQSQLSQDEVLLKVYPDTIFFDFGKLSKKVIKIIPKININYKTGYALVDKLEIEPQTVTINGSKEQIEKIDAIYTKPFELNDVIKDFEYKIPLDIPKEYHKINFSTKEITIKGIVEKFTEARIDVPFKVINVPKEYNIKTFIDSVKITYKVSLENYEKITSKDFKVICDYNEINGVQSNLLLPKITKKSDLVSNIKISPNKIEFLIKK